MKKRVILAGMLLLAFATAAIAVPSGPEAGEKKMSKKAEKLMAKAHKAIQAKQNDQAIDLLNQVIVIEPANAMVRHNLGVLLHQKGQTDEAIASFEEALKLQPDYLHAQLAIRQSLFEAGKNASARREMEKSNAYLLKLEAAPVPQGENINLRATAYYLLGFNFFNLKQNDKASEYFAKCQAVENLDKENRELYANATYFLGMLDHVKGDYPKSNENFRKYLGLYAASEAKPEFYNHASFFVGANLFRVLEAKMTKGEVGDMEQSVTEILPYLDKAIADKIPSEDAHVMLGNCHVYRKDFAKAIQAYQQLIAAYPQSTQLESYKTFLGELEKMQQQEQKAKKKR